MVELGQFALSLIIDLLKGVIQEEVNYKVLPFFERRKIERRIEDAIAEVVEPLLPFLALERIPEDKQQRLLQICVDELRPLTSTPTILFQGSLDGQKIFEQLYASRDLPEAVIEDGLKDIYTLLCPRIATMLCKIPAAVKDWENEAWSENYRRLDEIKTQLLTLFSIVDALAISPSKQADEILLTVRRSLAQKVRFELDLTGLRADSPQVGKFDDFFIHPDIAEAIEDRKSQPQVIRTQDHSLRQFLHPYHHAILIGSAGAGKSTWTKWLHRETFNTHWVGISIRVELRRFSNEPLLSLHDLVREIAGKHLAEYLTAERIGHWLDKEQLIFILDGFDEIPRDQRDNIYDWLIDLRLASKGSPFVLTSRPLTTDHLERLKDSGWIAWNIEPFDEPRIVNYIQLWYAHMPLLPDDNRDIDAKELATSWRKDPTIAPLTGNPLLLSTLLMVHHLDGSLPSGRSQLYRRYVDGMLGLWDDRRQVLATSVQLTLEQKRQIIQGFALKLFLEEHEQLDESATLEWLREFLKKTNISFPASETLAVLRERTGLIVGPGIYSFAHKSIAEYLVAEAIIQGIQQTTTGNRIDRFHLFEHRDDDRWNTVTFLWAGLASVADVETFIEQCLEAKNQTLGYGILYDQYDRIPIDIRRRHLQKICNQKFKRPLYKTSWAADRPAAIDDNLTIPTFPLRGLMTGKIINDTTVIMNFNNLSFNEVVYKATQDGTIDWSDQIPKGEWRDLLWMCFAREPSNIETWKACIASPCPKSASVLSWQAWAIEYSLGKSVYNEAIDLKSLLLAYQEARPRTSGLLPIMLMSTALELILEDDLSNQLTIKRIDKILEVLPDSDKGIMTPKWLLGTHEWIICFKDMEKRGPEEYIGDLLAVFIEQVEHLVEKGYIAQNTTYKRAIEFVHMLRVRRNTL